MLLFLSLLKGKNSFYKNKDNFKKEAYIVSLTHTLHMFTSLTDMKSDDAFTLYLLNVILTSFSCHLIIFWLKSY